MARLSETFRRLFLARKSLEHEGGEPNEFPLNFPSFHSHESSAVSSESDSEFSPLSANTR